MCFLLCFGLEAERDLWLINTQPQPRWPKPTPTNQNPTPIPPDPITNHPNNQRHQPRHNRRLGPISTPDRLLDRVESQIRANDELVSNFGSRARSWWTRGRRRKWARWATGSDLRRRRTRQQMSASWWARRRRDRVGRQRREKQGVGDREIEWGLKGEDWSLKVRLTEKWERKQNKKIIKTYATVVRIVANLWGYCSHVAKIIRFGTSDKGGFLCLVCQMCQIFGIWHGCYGCSYVGAILI